ncbi:O-antigen ligase family protein [Acerihabitans sp. TG2]|uniref:O-antigen ligase family protein n=1 Tax=Acerihabitans sp. TG2 TaxID=3096008 RepID=UPI002B22BFBE|nr:O-antigen ligase family protein [Acerihabitans sp. TG2]MEA9389286.1 O-antigen ligase family protein [Acerihabitans sp. TG2]
MVNKNRNLFSILFVILIYASILLPSGSILGVNVKTITAIFLMVAVLLIFISNSFFSFKEISLLLLFMAFMTFYSTLSIINGYSIASILSQISAILATIIPMWIGALIIRRGFLGLSKAINILITIALIHATIKLVSFVLITVGIISLADYTAMQSEIFGVLPISLEVDNFVRLNVPSDFIFPVVLMLCLISEMGYIRKYFSIAIILLAIVVTYSRYLWLYAVLVLLVYYCSSLFKSLMTNDARNSTGIKVSSLLFFIFIIALSVIIIIIFYMNNNTGNDFITNFIKERYTGDNASASDYTRTVMYTWLSSAVLDSPIIGSGLGSYILQYRRFYETPWNYELQWLALTMNFGIIGIIYIFTQLAIYYKKIIFNFFEVEMIDKTFVWIIGMVLWLSVGFFNCFLITSSAGVVFWGFWLYLEKIKEYNQKIKGS